MSPKGRPEGEWLPPGGKARNAKGAPVTVSAKDQEGTPMNAQGEAGTA